jgi:hypothetical protein
LDNERLCRWACGFHLKTVIQEQLKGIGGKDSVSNAKDVEFGWEGLLGVLPVKDFHNLPQSLRPPR